MKRSVLPPRAAWQSSESLAGRLIRCLGGLCSPGVPFNRLAPEVQEHLLRGTSRLWSDRLKLQRWAWQGLRGEWEVATSSWGRVLGLGISFFCEGVAFACSFGFTQAAIAIHEGGDGDWAAGFVWAIGGMLLQSSHPVVGEWTTELEGWSTEQMACCSRSVKLWALEVFHVTSLPCYLTFLHDDGVKARVSSSSVEIVLLATLALRLAGLAFRGLWGVYVGSQIMQHRLERDNEVGKSRSWGSVGTRVLKIAPQTSQTDCWHEAFMPQPLEGALFHREMSSLRLIIGWAALAPSVALLVPLLLMLGVLLATQEMLLWRQRRLEGAALLARSPWSVWHPSSLEPWGALMQVEVWWLVGLQAVILPRIQPDWSSEWHDYTQREVSLTIMLGFLGLAWALQKAWPVAPWVQVAYNKRTRMACPEGHVLSEPFTTPAQGGAGEETAT